MRKRLKMIIPLCLLAFLLYVILGAVLPYVRQPAVSEATKNSFDPEFYYGEGTGPDRAALIEDNGEALRLRLQMIAHAKERVILSTFDFRSDEAGKDVLAALLDAAKRGVSVEIFADGFNSILNMEGNAYFYALSSQPNVTIRIYNQINLLTPWTAMGRMHDKYVIVDEEAYLLGGRNTFAFFLGDYEGHKNYDREVLVYNTGSEESSLYEVLAYYEEITALPCCHIFHPDEELAKRRSVQEADAELTERFAAWKQSNPELFSQEPDYAAMTKETNAIHLLSNPITTAVKEPVVFYQLMELAKNAEEEVRIHTPYVICNDWMLECFAEIGDKTSILYNSAANNGNFFASIDYLGHKQDMIDTGMEIHEYEGGISYHGKSMTIDDELAIVGSFNMDMRSVYLDTELMLVIHSPAVTEDLKASMDTYEAEAAIVEDIDSYSWIPEGMELQEVDATRRNLRRFFGWLFDGLRFLM